MGGCTGAWLQETKPQLPSCACDSWVLDEANMKPHPPPAGTIGVAFWDKLSSLSVLWGVLSERGSKQVLSHTSMATSRSVVRCWTATRSSGISSQIPLLFPYSCSCHWLLALCPFLWRLCWPYTPTPALWCKKAHYSLSSKSANTKGSAPRELFKADCMYTSCIA